MSGMYKICFTIFFCFYISHFRAQFDSTVIKSADYKIYKTACSKIDSGKYQEAIEILKKVSKTNKTFVGIYNKLGFAKLKTNDYKGALKDLQLAYKITPDNYETQKTMAILYFETKKFQDAKVTLDSALSLRNDDPELLYYQAKLMYEGKVYKQALDLCSRILDLKPNYFDVLFLKGQIRFAMKEYAYCAKELEDAFSLMPADNPNYEAYKLRAKARFEIQNYKNAIKDWNVYLEAFPEDEAALISRGACKIEAIDNSGAIADLDAAIKINPKNPVSYNYRGVAKGEMRQFVEALKDFDYSIKLKYDYSGAFVNRAAVKFASKDKHGACDDLNRADSLGDEMAIKLIEAYCKNL
jgi:tetratricopeptide (TPR) repeat protein